MATKKMINDSVHRALLRRIAAIEKRLTTIERKATSTRAHCRTARRYSLRGIINRG